MTARRDYVYRLALRGYTIDMIVRGIQNQGDKLSFGPVSRRTVSRDIAAVREELVRTRTMRELYNVGQAIEELGEIWREIWQQYARPQVTIPTEEGGVIKVDDRMVKVAILKQATDIVVQKARLCGFYSPKAIEQLILMETAQARGMQFTKITIQEEVDQIVARLKSDKEFARREGLNPDDPTGAGSP